jgi:hypothetical protein
LSQLETHVHVEVQKLYPEAELPRFECIHLGDNRMQMLYRSHRTMGDLAHGLMLGCFRHFDEEIHIERCDLSNGAGSVEQFILTPVAGTGVAAVKQAIAPVGVAA